MNEMEGIELIKMSDEDINEAYRINPELDDPAPQDSVIYQDEKGCVLYRKFKETQNFYLVYINSYTMEEKWYSLRVYLPL